MFISRKEQIKKDTAEFESLIAALMKDLYSESVHNGDHNENILVKNIYVFASSNESRNQVRVSLNLITGELTIGFAGYVNPEKNALLANAVGIRPKYLEFSFEKFDNKSINPLRTIVKSYFEKGFSVFDELLYSGKKPQPRDNFRREEIMTG